MHNIILTRRLYRLYDPFPVIGLTWKMNLDRVVPVTRFRSEEYRTPHYHSGRVRYWVEMILQGEEIPPLLIDNHCEGLTIYAEPILLDGHHRFAAAILTGQRTLPISYGGRVDLLRYLKGIGPLPQD